MAFIEAPAFPQLLAYGASGGPAFSTVVSAGVAPVEARAASWPQERGVWEVGLVNRSGAETAALLAFFRCVAKGRVHGFRFRDFGAGESTGVHEPLGVGDGVTRGFQLVKRYQQGAVVSDRPIYKPVEGTVRVWVDGVLATALLVDATTGLVTFLVPPTSGAVLTASFTFDVPVRLDTDALRVRRVAPDAYSWESVTLRALADHEAAHSGSGPFAGGTSSSLYEPWEWAGFP